MALKSARHLGSRQVSKRATPGERVMGKLFPNRGIGFPGGWSSDRMAQTQHFTDWTYVAIHTICMKIASISPNMAWVSDGEQPGHTVKAGERSLLNLTHEHKKRFHPGFEGSAYIGGKTDFGAADPWRVKTYSDINQGGEPVNYASKWNGDRMGGSYSSYLTMGEYRSKALSVVKPHENLEPLESHHLLRRLVDNPNPFDTQFDYRYELMMFKLLCGVAYEWVIPNAFGKPCERWVLPSHWVWPRTGGNEHVDPEHPNADRLIQYYEVRPWGGMGSAGMLRLPPDQVIQHIFKSPINKLDGYSKLWAVSRWIDTEESISKSRWSQFINQARPEFWVEMGPSFVDPDDNMIARWEAKIAQKHQGEFNYGRPLFTPAGAKVTPLSFNPTEMAYFQCLDEETECLTAQGWKKYTELTKDTEIACFDPATKTLKYDKPTDVHVKPYKGKMFKWSGQRIDAMLSPNHRCYVRKHGENNAHDWEVLRVQDMDPTANFSILAHTHIGLIEEKLTPDLRTEVEYEGNIWCVTVPTGLFVVRRNGKAHITGNSEEQIRDMILSAFGVPKSAVGVVSDMTFGSVLATLMSFCEQCINPLLAQEGQVETKHLASRFDEETPAWSQGAGGRFGGAGTKRKCRLWYDNCAPADPAQVNSDIQVDLQGYSITPNELRVLRGRPPYQMGGDNPMVQGPGGIMPMPLNVEEEGEDLTDLVRQYSEAMAADKNATKLGTQMSNEDIPQSEVNPEGADAMRAQEQAGNDLNSGGAIDKPNSKPSKSFNPEHEKGLLGDTVQSAGRWLANKWQSLESRYGRAGALTMAVGMLATMPVPGNIALVIAAAEGIRGIHGALSPAKQMKAWQRRWTKGYQGHSYSSTQFNLADGQDAESLKEMMVQLVQTVPDEMLHAKGRETIPHVTIRYGLETSDAGEVRQLVETFGPVEVEFKYLDYFPGEQFDVIIIRCEGERLRKLNELLGQLPNVQTFPEYQPHLTLAYVQPGMGQEAMDAITKWTDDEQGVIEQTVNFTGLVFSPKEGTPSYVELASFKWQEATGADSQDEQVSAEKWWTKALEVGS